MLKSNNQFLVDPSYLVVDEPVPDLFVGQDFVTYLELQLDLFFR